MADGKDVKDVKDVKDGKQERLERWNKYRATPFDQLPPDKMKEMARKGAAKSREVQRQKRNLKEAAKVLLWHSLLPVPEEQEIVMVLKQMGIERPNGADAIMLAQYVKARRGDTEAARFIRDTAGEKPSQQVELNLAEKPLDAIDMSSLTDEQLMTLAAARNMTLIAGPVIDADLAEEPKLPKKYKRLPDPEKLPWENEEEIAFEQELSKPPKKKPGPRPMTALEKEAARWAKENRSPEEKAESERKQKLWLETSDHAQRLKREREEKMKEGEEAAYQVAFTERYGESDSGGSE